MITSYNDILPQQRWTYVRGLYSRSLSKHHYGVDLSTPIGSLVVAPNPGKVTVVFNDKTGGGLSLYMVDKYGQEWRFLHLSQVLHSVGDVVRRGQLIARSGNSGLSTTGPHLHLEVHTFPEQPHFYKKIIDPLLAK